MSTFGKSPEDFFREMVVLCLIDQWSIFSRRDPLVELIDLGIPVEKAGELIGGFVRYKYVRSKVRCVNNQSLSPIKILSQPNLFKDTYILTDKAMERIKRINFEHLKGKWLKLHAKSILVDPSKPIT